MLVYLLNDTGLCIWFSMKKIIVSLLISFISCSFYAQGIFDVNYNRKEKDKFDEELKKLEENDSGDEYDYAKEIGITEEDEKLEIERQNNFLEGNHNFTFFSDAIEQNIRLYKINSKVANEKEDLDRANYLYDSLVNNCLKKTHFDNFLVTKANGDLTYFDSFEKPIYLKTISTWCEPNDSEAAAFNDVADEFSDLIDFVVLYWDPKHKIDQVAEKYNRNVTVLYVDETDNYSSDIVTALKHSLGLPTLLLMDQERMIIDVRRGATPKYTPEPSEGIKKYGTFNPGTTKDHFVNSYGDYFDQLVIDVNTIIGNM